MKVEAIYVNFHEITWDTMG